MSPKLRPPSTAFLTSFQSIPSMTPFHHSHPLTSPAKSPTSPASSSQFINIRRMSFHPKSTSPDSIFPLIWFFLTYLRVQTVLQTQTLYLLTHTDPPAFFLELCLHGSGNAKHPQASVPLQDPQQCSQDSFMFIYVPHAPLNVGNSSVPLTAPYSAYIYIFFSGWFLSFINAAKSPSSSF